VPKTLQDVSIPIFLASGQLAHQDVSFPGTLAWDARVAYLNSTILLRTEASMTSAGGVWHIMRIRIPTSKVPAPLTDIVTNHCKSSEEALSVRVLIA
jgi:hypothetical protein